MTSRIVSVAIHTVDEDTLDEWCPACESNAWLVWDAEYHSDTLIFEQAVFCADCGKPLALHDESSAD